MKKRLDLICVERGIFENRHKAQAAIMAGKVIVNGKSICKAGTKVSDSDDIFLEKEMPYVSRSGIKLKAALESFKINLRGKICADIGVATGGFSDCMLQEGARVVYGVDVGKGQVHEKVRANPGFVFMPGTNARFLKEDSFKKKPVFAAVDVSFISLRLVLPSLFCSMAENFEAVILIKPQFELSPEDLKKGIVRNDKARFKAVNVLRNFLIENYPGIAEMGLINSPIKGAKGNLEFLWHLKSRNRGQSQD